MNMSSISRTAVIALFMGLVGCAPARVALRPSFWKDTQSKVGVAAVPAPKLAAYRSGNQGLLDLVINEAMAGSLEAHLQHLDANGISSMTDHYVEKLNERGVNARKLSRTVNPLTFQPFTAPSSGEFAERDLRPLAQQEGIDKLILISLQQCGTSRAYYGFIPLGAPKAMCVGKGEMIDLKTNQIEWRAYPETNDATQDVVGEWDEPPDYRNVTAAINRTMTRTQVLLFEDFFGPRTARPETWSQGLALHTASSSTASQSTAPAKPGCTDTPEYRNASAVQKKQLLEACKQE